MSKKLQKILSVVLAAVLVVCGMPLVVGAAEYYGGLQYEIMEDNTVEITG